MKAHRTISTTAIVAVMALTETTWAQPIIKLWVTEVYEVNPDGSYTPKCDVNCPTQDLPPGIAQPGDLINIETTVEGWDADTDTGTCDPEGEACSVSAQDCPNSHCSGVVTAGHCTNNSNCFVPDTCDPDKCGKSPLMGGFQWTIDSSTYSNGGPGPGLAPARLACSTDADCACAYREIPGDFNDCADLADFGFCTCSSSVCDGGVCDFAGVAYIDSSFLTNYIFFTEAEVSSLSFATPDFAFAAVLLANGVSEDRFRCSAGTRRFCDFDAECQDGTCELAATSPYYMGTLLLEATSDACGMFTVDLDHDPNNTAIKNFIGTPFAGLIIEALTIDFGGQGEDCNGNGRPDECDIDCGPPGGPCGLPGCGGSEDCNGNGVPDECDTPVCGDGCVMGTEECDDGNTAPGDGCAANCLFEPGACCLGMTCNSRTESDCLDSGGTFFGFLTTCAAPDADGDGLRDECDGCPDDSNKIEPGICGCGVDDSADSDDDGVPDCIDQCPDVDDTIYAPECIEAIPTVSDWGLVIVTLLLLAGAKVVFNRRRKTGDA